MNRLIGFELRKIMTLRVWIAMAGSLALAIFYFVSFYPSGTNSLLVVNKEKPELIAAHVGAIQPKFALKYAPRLKEEYAEDSEGPIEEKMTRILEQRYASAAYQADQFNMRLSELRKSKALLEKQEQRSFALKDITKQLFMFEKVEAPGFYVTTNWGSLYRFFSVPGVGNLLLGLVLVFAVAPLYSGEINNRMDALILSSKYGRLRIVMAKLIAGLVVTVSWITLFYGVCVLFSCLPFGFVGSSAPLNSYFEQSPYDLTQLQGLLLKYAITLLAACGLLLFIALISAFSRSSLSSLGLGACVVLLPHFSLPGIIGKLIEFMPSGVLMSRSLIERYESYNIFDIPVLYMPLAIVSVCGIGMITLLLIPRTFERQLKG